MASSKQKFLGRSDSLLVWQIADSAFPCGGFVHSGGLEANFQFRQVEAETLPEWIDVQLTAAARGILPFVFAAYDDPERLADIDRDFHAFMKSPVASRASRAQGQSLLASLLRIFDTQPLARLNVASRNSNTHFSPIFGAAMSLFGLERDETGRLFLFMCLRGWISAAVRLGIVGPIEGQQIQARHSQHVGRLVVVAGRTGIDDAAQTAPLLEILQGGHDRLYSRLFQS